jgi:hypothetical protein
MKLAHAARQISLPSLKLTVGNSPNLRRADSTATSVSAATAATAALAFAAAAAAALSTLVKKAHFAWLGKISLSFRFRCIRQKR